MIAGDSSFDALEFVREYRANYVNLHTLWTTVAEPPAGIELSTPNQTPITEADLPAELQQAVREYRRRHPEVMLSFIKHMRIVNGQPVRVIEDERGLPPENEFMSLSRTLTLNTSGEAQTVTEIYVAQIERRRG
jgi:hypothetical protein